MELDIPLIRNKASGPGTNNFGYSEEISEYPEGEQAGQDQDVCSRKREASGIERTVQYRKELCVFRFRELRKIQEKNALLQSIWIYIHFKFTYRSYGRLIFVFLGPGDHIEAPDGAAADQAGSGPTDPVQSGHWYQKSTQGFAPNIIICLFLAHFLNLGMAPKKEEKSP